MLCHHSLPPPCPHRRLFRASARGLEVLFHSHSRAGGPACPESVLSSARPAPVAAEACPQRMNALLHTRGPEPHGS